jgi:dTMP kinase
MSARNPRGRLITIEGIDGAGKSTHLPAVRALVEARGHAVWSTREPGGTPLGEHMRALLLSQPMTPVTELMLMFAARREHCEREIWPRLAAGEWVVCDRFSDATYAYQGGGRGVDMTIIAEAERLALGAFRPDLTLLFDIPVDEARRRLADGRALDRFESEQSAFFERVRQCYLARAAGDPARCRVVDAARPREQVGAEVRRILEAIP